MYYHRKPWKPLPNPFERDHYARWVEGIEEEAAMEIRERRADNRRARALDAILNPPGMERNPFFAALTAVIFNREMLSYKKNLVMDAMDGLVVPLRVRGAGEEARNKVENDLRGAVRDSSSALYRALNYQRNCIPVTFGGARALIAFNYARSLQELERAELDTRGDAPDV